MTPKKGEWWHEIDGVFCRSVLLRLDATIGDVLWKHRASDCPALKQETEETYCICNPGFESEGRSPCGVSCPKHGKPQEPKREMLKCPNCGEPYCSDSAMSHLHTCKGKPQEPKAQEWTLHIWPDGKADHVIGCAYRQSECSLRHVVVHDEEPCQRERERLRGLLAHDGARHPFYNCDQCREIEEALK